MTIGTQQAQIEALYIGYFNRSSEPAGLAYWVGQLDSGMPLAQIAESFSVQPEATALYPFLANPAAGGIASFLGAVYANLYNRPIDAAGVAYWTAQIDGGRTIGPIILDLTSGAQGDDALTLANKAAVGLAYAHMFDSARETWTTADRWSAHDVVAGVTFDPATVTAAEAKIMGLFAPTPTPTPAPPPTPTSTPTPTPMPGPTPTSTAMDLTNAGNSVALAGTIGAISLTGADLATYPADAFGTVALALASGKLWVVSTAGGTLSAAANSAATSYHFGTGVVGGADAIDSKMTYQGFNSYIASPNGDTVTLTATGQNVTGGAGADTINGGPGTHAVSGGGGVDTFNVTAGTVAISDLGNGGADVVAVSAGATANATLAAAWTATASAANAGTASVNANGFNVSVASASGANGWTLTNSGGAATLTGSANADTIIGGAGADTLTGGAQNDTMTGGAGIDTFNVDAGTDSITDFGVGGVENLVIASSAATSITLTSAWTATASSSNNGTASINAAGFTLNVAAVGGTSGWTLSNTGGGATITGSGNADTISGGAGADTLVGGDGGDSLTGNGGNDTMTGGGSGDTFNVNAGTDTITDLGNADILVVSAGATANATLFADWTATAASSNAGTANLTGAGRDINVGAATGTSGWKLTNTGAGAWLIGSAQDDSITGGAGHDFISGGLGSDALAGGGGNDTFIVRGGTTTISDLGNGGDVVRVMSGTVHATLAAAWQAINTTLIEWASTAIVDAAGFGLDLRNATIYGSMTVTNSGGAATLLGSASSNNTISGGTGADTLIGGPENDSLTGGGGNDTIDGSYGNDTITGGAGADVLTGGWGGLADTFGSSNNFGTIGEGVAPTATTFFGGTVVVGSVITFGNGVDRITDFVQGTDKLDVTQEGTAPINVANHSSLSAIGSGLTVVAYGNFNAITGDFTIQANFDATTAPDAIVIQGNGGSIEDASGWVAITGLAHALAGGDFV
jgi:Ca2+-binding RTX toxin-like protein